MNIEETISKHITRRAGAIGRDLIKYLEPEREARFFMAGGCLTGQIRDVDLFPGPDNPPLIALEEISVTKNATTYRSPNWPIQVCRYTHDTLEALVDSFDFAHIQVGVEWRKALGLMEVTKVYFTNEFVAAQALKISWFTGSGYPLSSLIRAGKYYKQGALPRGSYLRCVLGAVKEVIERGFENYDDFKNQLDAVDLGMLPDEFNDLEDNTLREIFELLRKDKP